MNARGGFYAVDSLRSVHVLVVENDDDTLELLTTILRYCGALVTAVSSAEEAFELMKQVRPDVLVIDIAMPMKDGYWLLAAVRSLKPEDGGNLPAIAVTALARPEDVERGRAAGFEIYLTKPLNPWELCRAVSQLTLPR